MSVGMAHSAADLRADADSGRHVYTSVETAVDGGIQPLRVLVCENDHAMAASLRELIVDTPGMTLVGIAADADAAAELARDTTPDAVILDVRMAGGGGPRAARLIRTHVPNVRLVAFSAHSDRQSVLAMLRAGVHEYLVKGVDEHDLTEALRRTGRGRISLSPLDIEELLVEVVEMLGAAEAERDAARHILAENGAVQ